MYFIVRRDLLPANRHYELMPDGRAIVSGREARLLGTLEGVTVVPDANTLRQMMQGKTV